MGVAGGGGADLDITDAELGLITAANLELATIVGATGGDIFVNAITQGSSAGIAGTITLTSVGSTISFEGAASEFSNSLNAQANNGITVSKSLSTFAGNAGSITLNGDADDPAVGGTDDVVIVSSDAAVVSISADGALNISGRSIDFGESATLTGADVTLNATNGGSITLSGADATTNKNTITSTGDANTISLTGGGVVVSPNNPDLILNSEGSLVLTNINIGDGTLTANIDTNNNGTESLTIGTGVVIGASGSAALNGGTDDNDTLVGSGTTSVFVLSATDSGTLTDGGESFGFSAFGGIDGALGTDSLTGLSAGTSTWTIDADPTYVNGGTLDFTGIENLTGGASTDNFTVTVDPTGDIKGGAGDDSFAVNTTLAGMVDGDAGTADELSFGSVAAVTLAAGTNGFAGTVASIGGGFDGINTLTGSGVGGDTLTGLGSGTSTWTIDGAPMYVNGGTLDFSGFENLTGGASTDNFTVTVDPTGDLTGGDGDDTFDIDVTLAGAVDGGADTDIANFADVVGALLLTIGTDVLNVEILVGNSNGGSRLTGPAGGNSWDINPAEEGTVAGVAFSDFPQLQAGAGGDIFNFNVSGDNFSGPILGGAGDDQFVFINGATVSGGIDGGDSVTADGDVLDLSLYATPTDIDFDTGTAQGFDGTATGIVAFDNISTIRGGMVANTLIGPDLDNTWTLNSVR